MSYLKSLPDRLDEIPVVAKRAGDRADELACTIIELLEEIRDSVGSSDVRPVEIASIPFNTGAAGSKVAIPAREGYVKTLKYLAIEAGSTFDGALRLGSPTGPLLISVNGGTGDAFNFEIPIPENADVHLVDNAGATNASITLVIERTKL